eukprot:11168156-Lingulodinium_polyedra.AAC.1
MCSSCLETTRCTLYWSAASCGTLSALWLAATGRVAPELLHVACVHLLRVGCRLPGMHPSGPWGGGCGVKQKACGACMECCMEIYVGVVEVMQLNAVTEPLTRAHPTRTVVWRQGTCHM